MNEISHRRRSVLLPAEIVVGLLEREREILSIVEELNELLGNNRGKGDTHAEGS